MALSFQSPIVNASVVVGGKADLDRTILNKLDLRSHI
jgi:hypothetical protein